MDVYAFLTWRVNGGEFSASSDPGVSHYPSSGRVDVKQLFGGLWLLAVKSSATGAAGVGFGMEINHKHAITPL